MNTFIFVLFSINRWRVQVGVTWGFALTLHTRFNRWIGHTSLFNLVQMFTSDGMKQHEHSMAPSIAIFEWRWVIWTRNISVPHFRPSNDQSVVEYFETMFEWNDHEFHQVPGKQWTSRTHANILNYRDQSDVALGHLRACHLPGRNNFVKLANAFNTCNCYLNLGTLECSFHRSHCKQLHLIRTSIRGWFRASGRFHQSLTRVLCFSSQYFLFSFCLVESIAGVRNGTICNHNGKEKLNKTCVARVHVLAPRSYLINPTLYWSIR